MTTTATDRLRDLIAEELDAVIDIRRDLHAHPELGYEEHRTCDVVKRELTAAGVSFKAGLAGGTGVLGHIPGQAETAIGLRADMDALPIQELNDLPYRSIRDGIMHACGHDGHTAMLIATARVLARLAADAQIPRPVTFVFQPAEEGGAGGQRMVQDGCLDGSVIGPPVEHMFGQHGWPSLPVHTVGTRKGAVLAAADRFNVKITGVGGHAAYPHIGHDPIVAGAAIVSTLQTIVSRNAGPLDSIVVSVTQFHGGTTHNIIPQEIILQGTVRTLLQETQDLAQKRIREIAEQVAMAHGCTAEVVYDLGYPVTLNDAGAVDIFNQVATSALGAERVEDLPEPTMGGEDFAFYCHEKPSCFFALGLMAHGHTEMPQLHHPRFNFNDDAIATGVEMFCRLALREDA